MFGINLEKKYKSWTYKFILPSVLWLFMKLLTDSLKLRIIGEVTVDHLRKQGKRIVYAIWHGRQFILVSQLPKKHVSVMSSTSRDGRLQAAILRKFGFEIVFGSSRRSAVRALVGVIKKMNKGWDVAMAVDGPTGPIHQVKPGALFLAKKCGACVVPLGYSTRRGIVMKAWDRYLLPIPFSRTVFIYGEPLYPSPDMDQETMDRENLELKAVLDRMMKKADRIAGRHGT
jgi:lysophospholipid acyltransferase (LPLAT)-like uncharacterized protein